MLISFSASCSTDGSSEPTWSAADPEAFDEARAAQAQKAADAKDAMMSALLQELFVGLEQRGPAGAISVCKQEAPRIGREVGSSEGVRIGRTAHRLRNPSNVAPDWAADLIHEEPAAPRYASSDQGDLGVTFPIHLKAACLMCHGPEETLEPDVRAALAEQYPEDRATGFAEGDLRGWFWVEVPAAGG